MISKNLPLAPSLQNLWDLFEIMKPRPVITAVRFARCLTRLINSKAVQLKTFILITVYARERKNFTLPICAASND